MRYYSTAVVHFQIQPSEAWLLTPQEYWSIYDTWSEKMNPKRQESDQGGAPRTQQDIKDLEAYLVKIGKL